MVQLALMIALVVAVSFIPVLGYIPLVVIKATTVHIPVIIGAIILGPKAGAVLGFTMGMTSIIKNTIEPSLTSFVFSPFIPVPGSDSGDIRALLIAIVPRMLIGVVAGLVYRLVSMFDKKGFAACGAAALLGTLTNTGLVMGGIYMIFGHQYAQAINVGFEMLGTFIMGVVATNGLAEAAVAMVLCILLIRPLMKALKRRSINNAEKEELKAAAAEAAEQSLTEETDPKDPAVLD
ncbi:MAG: ECF transporter S component [Oscillospiraceae bacterium]|nr:ECF transporter S component [Oscillospiraceae bacterium]